MATIYPQQGKQSKVKTAKGTEVLTEFCVVEAATLITSHDACTGTKNPDFPAELQPRDRERGTSRAWVMKTAGNLDPEQLGSTRRADTGAPIVGADGIVESGNGRAMAIALAYAHGTAHEYREWLEAEAGFFGFSPAIVQMMAQPVLVRLRTSEVDRAAFVVEANQDDKLAMTATEKARADARRLSEDMICLMTDNGDLTAASNRAFLSAFLQSLGDAEAAQYTTTDGKPTCTLIARVQAAIFARAYNDDRLLELTADVAKPEVANLLHALNFAAPEFIQADALDVARNDDPSLTAQAVGAIIGAANLLKQAREIGVCVEEVIKQQGLFSDMDPAMAVMAVFISKNNRSSKRLGTAFKAMASFVKNEVSRRQTADIFGDVQRVNFEDIVNAANAEMDRVFGEGAFFIETGDLFSGPAAVVPDDAPVVASVAQVVPAAAVVADVVPDDAPVVPDDAPVVAPAAAVVPDIWPLFTAATDLQRLTITMGYDAYRAEKIQAARAGDWSALGYIREELQRLADQPGYHVQTVEARKACKRLGEAAAVVPDDAPVVAPAAAVVADVSQASNAPTAAAAAPVAQESTPAAQELAPVPSAADEVSQDLAPTEAPTAAPVVAEVVADAAPASQELAPVPSAANEVPPVQKLKHGKNWAGQDLTGWAYSEKLDGCRAYWDGVQFWGKDGQPLHLPEIAANMPAGVVLDGEIWAGRGNFEAARLYVQYGTPSELVRFVAFDAPTAKGTWAQRLQTVQGVECVTVHAITSMTEMAQEVADLLDAGAEGVMCHAPQVNAYRGGRDATLIKIKAHTFCHFEAFFDHAVEAPTAAPVVAEVVADAAPASQKPAPVTSAADEGPQVLAPVVPVLHQKARAKSGAWTAQLWQAGGLCWLAFLVLGAAAPVFSSYATRRDVLTALQRLGAGLLAQGGALGLVEHTTARGKVLRGVVRADLTKAQAQALDAYTFRKDGGWFIRERHLTEAAPVVAQAVQVAPAAQEVAQVPTVADKVAQVLADAQQATAADERAALLAQFAHLEQGGGPAVASRNIKRELKRVWPGVVFSVRKSHTGAVNVQWANGPTEGQVNALLRRFKLGSFDGMTDCYEYRADAFSDLFGGCHYLFTRRTEGAELVQRAIDALFSGCADVPSAEDYQASRGKFDWRTNEGRSWAHWVRDALAKLDATAERADVAELA